MGLLINSGINILKAGTNLASGGPLKRGLFGASVGGIIGAAQNTNDPNSRTESIAKGALIGSLAGSIGFRKGSFFGKTVPVPAIGQAANILGLSGKGLSKTLAKSALKTTGRAGMFIAENPKTALGIGIGVGTVTGTVTGRRMYNSSVSESDFNPMYTSESSQGGIAAITGGTGQIGTGQVMNRKQRSSRKSFQDSVVGLIQGLHRGRHG